MQLYETGLHKLREFLANEKTEGAFTENYLILYNFATDCKYSSHIESDLILRLLPFYLKTMEQAVLYKNTIAADIYFELNQALFFNRNVLWGAIGATRGQQLMTYYRMLTLKKMELQNLRPSEWISLFNTTVALDDANILKLFCRIFEGSCQVRYSFFQYLSILLFKESDNLCVLNETRPFWTSCIWDFDGGYTAKRIFWNDYMIDFFNKEVVEERAIDLFEGIKPFLCGFFNEDSMSLLQEEMYRSFDTGIFRNRKAEFLKKIQDTSKTYTYWDATF